MAMGHNLGHHNLRNTPWLHRRVDVDYNGWWMCLIPTAVIKEIGLSLPLFLKWDDAEYGLRAKAAASLPCLLPVRACGTFPGLIRMTRSAGRRTTTSATALITALLHSPFDKGGRVLLESPVLGRQAHPVHAVLREAGRLMALEDLLLRPRSPAPLALAASAGDSCDG